jgi:ribosomal protein S9
MTLVDIAPPPSFQKDATVAWTGSMKQVHAAVRTPATRSSLILQPLARHSLTQSTAFDKRSAFAARRARLGDARRIERWIASLRKARQRSDYSFFW